MTVRVRDDLTPSLTRIRADINGIPAKALAVWIENTPVKTGHARRSTRLRDHEIQARYPYAERLDQGWSRQRPQGMSKPVRAWLQQQYKRIFRK